jgi:hypothetical protein
MRELKELVGNFVRDGGPSEHALRIMVESGAMITIVNVVIIFVYAFGNNAEYAMSDVVSVHLCICLFMLTYAIHSWSKLS